MVIMRRKRMFISIVLSLLFVVQAGFLQASEINYRIVDTDELKKLLKELRQTEQVPDFKKVWRQAEAMESKRIKITPLSPGFKV